MALQGRIEIEKDERRSQHGPRVVNVNNVLVPRGDHVGRWGLGIAQPRSLGHLRLEVLCQFSEHLAAMYGECCKQ